MYFIKTQLSNAEKNHTDMMSLRTIADLIDKVADSHESSNNDDVLFFTPDKENDQTTICFLLSCKENVNCDEELFVYALVLIDTLNERAKVKMVENNKHNLFGTALLIANKLEMDRHFSNACFAKVCDMSLKTMNDFELRFCDLMDFDIQIPESLYNEYAKEIRFCSLLEKKKVHECSDVTQLRSIAWKIDNVINMHYKFVEEKRFTSKDFVGTISTMKFLSFCAANIPCDMKMFIVALALLDRFIKSTDVKLVHKNKCNLFGTALMVSVKTQLDDHPCNADFATVFDIEVENLNEFETCFCNILKSDVHVSDVLYTKYKGNIMSYTCLENEEELITSYRTFKQLKRC